MLNVDTASAIKIAKKPSTILATAFSMLLGLSSLGGYHGYQAARDFIIKPIKTRMDEAKELTFQSQFNHQVYIRLMFTKQEIDSVKNILIEDKAKEKFCKEFPGLCLQKEKK